MADNREENVQDHGLEDCDSRRELRALVVRGSNSHLGCYSLPLLLQVSLPTLKKAKAKALAFVYILLNN